MDNAPPRQYRLTRLKTEAATGYFDCVPVDDPEVDTALAFCRQTPNDEFMRKHLLRRIAAWPPETMQERILGTPPGDPFLRALLFEACLLVPRFKALRRHFPARERKALAQASPLVFIKSHLLPDQRLHRRWIQHLRSNLLDHAPLRSAGQMDLAAPVSGAAAARAMAVATHLDQLATEQAPAAAGEETVVVSPEELTALALERLSRAGVQLDREMRHESSLSPVALLRSWQLAVTVDCDRHRYHLEGEQISYGRGLELEDARVACTMEIVERVSSYAAISGGKVNGCRRDHPLVHAPLSQLQKEKRTALDPNRLGLEAPYRDEPLYWIEGQTADAKGGQPILVPAQCVFLFCNLDEIKLFSGLGSNGLGAGTSLAQARCKALLEVIERDSAATVPYVQGLCFDIETENPRIARLLQSYAALGIQVGFLDITGPLGLPCCKSFVAGTDGRIAIGTGAHLNAQEALISALTETTYPFPKGPPSKPLPPASVRVPLEALPNYDQGRPEANLRLLEQLLLTSGFDPVYIDLTRADLDLPVVRAIVPGMEMLGDFDRHSRVHPRLFGHYLKYAPS